MKKITCVAIFLLTFFSISLAGTSNSPPSTEGELHAALKTANPDYIGKAKINKNDKGKIWGINLNNCNISDLSPLKGMDLEAISCVQNNISDISPLFSMKLKQFLCADNPIEDLTPLAGMPLWKLAINKTKVTDLTPLKGVPIQEIYFNPSKIIKGIEVLRNMESLSVIWVQLDKDEKDDKATLQFKKSFWELYDKGEYKK